MKKMSLQPFLEKESKKEQKQVNYKQVETKDDDKKADVDQEAKCSTRQEQNDRIKDLFVIFRREELEGRFRVTREEE